MEHEVDPSKSGNANNTLAPLAGYLYGAISGLEINVI